MKNIMYQCHHVKFGNTEIIVFALAIITRDEYIPRETYVKSCFFFTYVVWRSAGSEILVILVSSR